MMVKPIMLLIVVFNQIGTLFSTIAGLILTFFHYYILVGKVCSRHSFYLMRPLHLYTPHQTYIIFSKSLIPEYFGTMRTLAFTPLNNCPFFFQYVLNIILQCYFPLMMELGMDNVLRALPFLPFLISLSPYLSNSYSLSLSLSLSSHRFTGTISSHIFFSDSLYLFWHLNPYSAVYSWSTPSLNTEGCGLFQLLQKQNTN